MLSLHKPERGHFMEAKKPNQNKGLALKEDSLCSCCTQNEVETELHVLANDLITHTLETLSLSTFHTTTRTFFGKNTW